MVAQPPEDPEEPTGDDTTPIDRGLSTRQEQAIIALLSEASVTKAASVCGVPERTIYNWLEEPRFSKAFRGTRRRAFGHAISLLQHYAPMAVQTLAKVMTDPQAPHSARVSAANNLLKGAREGIELDEMSARIEALEKSQEAALKASGAGGGGRWQR